MNSVAVWDEGLSLVVFVTVFCVNSWKVKGGWTVYQVRVAMAGRSGFSSSPAVCVTFSSHTQSSTAFVEQIVDIPVPGGGLHDSLLDPGSAAPPAVSRDELGQRFFRTLPRSQISAREFDCEGARALELIHDVAKREAKRQETHRQAEEALKRARVLLDQGKRKRKKERKKRLPRSSPLPRRVSGCRLRSTKACLQGCVHDVWEERGSCLRVFW